MEEKDSKHLQQTQPPQQNQPQADKPLQERAEQLPGFQELIRGVYREEYLKTLGEALAAQARETNRYLAYRELQFRAEAIKREYPDFDLERELENPTFARLLNNGVDPKIAFEVVHHGEQSRREERLAQNAARPVENGLTGLSAAVSKSDPRALSRQERRELRRRAARGEEIVW